MSMWADYQAELIGARVIETEAGFVSFTDHPETNSVFIRDMFVIAGKRNSGEGSRLLSVVAEWARKAGRKLITASVSYESRTHEQSLIAQIKSGFKISAVSGGIVYTYIEVTGV